MAERLADAESSSQFLSRDHAQASAALQALEHRRARGEDVADAEVKRAEKTLATAKAKAHEPWPERISGLRGALRDADGAVQRFAAERWDELSEELADEARIAAERVDDCLRELDRLYQQREEIARRTDALIATVVGRSRPNLVATSRVEQLVRDAAGILMGGGERAPTMVRDPRQPTAGQLAGELS